MAVYVNDLCIVMKDPETFLEQLQSPTFNFKLKGSEKLNFHLGCGFQHDKTGTLCMDPGKYIQKMEEA